MSIDLRSDTVTRPSSAMRQAIAAAEVGDDGLDGDPTTRRLEEGIAERLGFERALFFPSGTQANLTALMLHSPPGTEVLLEAHAHQVQYEDGGVAALAGVQIRPIRAEGRLTADVLRAEFPQQSPYLPSLSLIAIENTHSQSGGRVTSPEAWDDIVTFAREVGIPVHVDGARLWHAAIAAGVPVARLVRGAQTAMVSFSKGLGCPVGSCLAGSSALMERARTIRRRLGGGMRQSGVLAAAALYALEHHLDDLSLDHERALAFAFRLSQHAIVRSVQPESNIVMLDLPPDRLAEDAAAQLASGGLLLSVYGVHRLRVVFHRDIQTRDVERAADLIFEVLR